MNRLLLLLFLSLPAWANDGVLDEFWRETKTFSASFVQVTVNEDQAQTQKREGKVAFSRPGRIYWKYTTPPETIVADGNTLWIYDEELATVTRQGLDQALAAAPLALFAGEKVERFFRIEQEKEKEGVLFYRLTPKSPEDSSYKAVWVGFCQKSLCRLAFDDGFGNKTTVFFSQVKVNPPLDGSLFRFSPPKGVDVIDGRG